MNSQKNRDADLASSDDSIGRPAEWREGRYEKAGTEKDQSVAKKPGEAPPDDTSTPVTKEEYEQ